MIIRQRRYLAFGTFLLGLFLSSCITTAEHVAYVTIYNEGDLAVLASVNGIEQTLDARSYSTWDIDLGNSSSTSVDLYAVQVDDSRYSVSETITLAAGEVYLWPIGWYSQ
jgi:hypothetical protein